MFSAFSVPLIICANCGQGRPYHYMYILVNIPIVTVGRGPMCPPENTSSVRPLPNPPQREGTMIPTKPCRSVFSVCSVPIFNALKTTDHTDTHRFSFPPSLVGAPLAGALPGVKESGVKQLSRDAMHCVRGIQPCHLLGTEVADRRWFRCSIY